ncbi:MAG: formate dehydrogenase accessory sulfurtransferase FdhD [Anaerolineae bacterium]|nr:formate dehydrogenase accessory sulfurtransferase FdhD [Anaerolineae bacterium]
MTEGIHKTSFLQLQAGVARPIAGTVPVEEEVLLYVNGSEWVALRCTPLLLEELGLGFLYNEGFIDGMADVAEVRLCGSGRCVDIWLHKDVHPPALRAITSGCSGGTSFESLVKERSPLTTQVNVTPDQVAALMQALNKASQLYRQSRGIHAAALAESSELIVVAEDLGRHNTLDKLAGICLRRGLTTQGRILLTSGRISSEMLSKAARMETPVVISRTSPTSFSIELASAWGITLIGYARGQELHLYTGAQRLSGIERPG